MLKMLSMIVGLMIVSINIYSLETLQSPYHACEKVKIVDQKEYDKNSQEWNDFEKRCNEKIQVIIPVGIKDIDPLAEGASYLSLASTVASLVSENLEKSRKYAECAKLCFSGLKICNPRLGETGKIVSCEERRNEILAKVKTTSRKLRLELALANDAPGVVSANKATILDVDDEKKMNTDLRSFEFGLPNPVGNMNISEREKSFSMRKLKKERKELEEEFKMLVANKAIRPDVYRSWMSEMLMKKREKHQEEYRRIVYEELPLLAVIGNVKSFEDGNPIWSDEDYKKAFEKLADNAAFVNLKVQKSIKVNKLEFSRIDGQAFVKWMRNLGSGVDHVELLYFMGMHNQVNEVLKKHPEYCGIATRMAQRLESKEMQNAGLAFGVSFIGAPVVRTSSAILSSTFRIARVLTGAEAASVFGAAMGSVTLGETFEKYGNKLTEAESRSGISELEGDALRTAVEINYARSGALISLAMAPVGVGTSWSTAKIYYRFLGDKMKKEFPEIARLMAKGKTSESEQNLIVDQWLNMKIAKLVKAGRLAKDEEAYIRSEAGRNYLDLIANEIIKKRPQFLENPDNMNLIFKVAARFAKKEAGDPSDLSQKSLELFTSLNPAIFKEWDLTAKSGMMKVFENAMDELRNAAKNNPADYAKIGVDVQAKERILLPALLKSGVLSESERRAMFQCLF